MKERKKEKDELHIAVQGFSISQIHFKSVCRARWSAMITQTKAGARRGRAAEAGEAAGAGGAVGAKWRCANNNYHWQLRATEMPTNETAAS